MEVITPTKKRGAKKKKPITLEVTNGQSSGPLQVVRPKGFALPPFNQPPPKNANFSAQQITTLRYSLAGKPQKEIAKLMGISTGTVSTHLSRAKEKLDQNSLLRQALEKKGATLDKVADVLYDALGAESTIITKHGAATNKDHRVRLEAAKYLTNLHGAEPAKKIEVEHVSFEQRLVMIARMEDAEEAACGD